jgi:hypothetical protein
MADHVAAFLAAMKLYPDSGHGHCFQYAFEHVKHVEMFLEL